ncbi:hypothetical protein BGZ60DRAFT_552511 [Tricladium varicosporioides]|nr:hypothetical protein BGZ60DRAFT_552511 [Hymenoscyphus varicosporioides]
MSKELFIPAGALPFSNASIPRGFTENINPYASGYHLPAAFAAQDATSETLSTTGGPGLGDSTSLCHAWASALTGELSRHVLRIQAVSPGFSEWVVAPQTLGLDWAKGAHPTPYGSLSVSWAFDAQGNLSMNVTNPVGTNGMVNLPSPMRILNSTALVNGKGVLGSSFAVVGGKVFNLTQTSPNFENGGDTVRVSRFLSRLSVTLAKQDTPKALKGWK